MRSEYDFSKGTKGKYRKPAKTWWWDSRLLRNYLLAGLIGGLLVAFFDFCWWLAGL